MPPASSNGNGRHKRIEAKKKHGICPCSIFIYDRIELLLVSLVGVVEA